MDDDQSKQFRIPLLGKMKKIPLPPLSVWYRIVDKSSINEAFLDVKITGYGCLFKSKHCGTAYSIIGNKGYIVIYEDTTKLTGYALYLAEAKKVTITKKKEKTKICIKWKFGKLTILLDEDTASGRSQFRSILDALKCSPAEGRIQENYHRLYPNDECVTALPSSSSSCKMGYLSTSTTCYASEYSSTIYDAPLSLSYYPMATKKDDEMPASVLALPPPLLSSLDNVAPAGGGGVMVPSCPVINVSIQLDADQADKLCTLLSSMNTFNPMATNADDNHASAVQLSSLDALVAPSISSLNDHNNEVTQ
jgi:phage anti-repressor protein